MKARWMIWTLLAVLCWGVWALCSRLVGDAVSPELNQSLSTLGILPVLLYLAAVRKPEPVGDATRGRMLAFGSGLLTCLGNIAYYKVLASGARAATVVPLTALYPMVTILLAVLLLRERLNRIQAAGIGLAMIAIYFFNVQTEAGILSPWLLAAAVPIAMWGASGLLQKLATNQVSGETSTLWFLASFVPVGLFLAWREPLPESLPPRVWGLLLLLGLTFAFGNAALLLAFASGGKASVIAPIAGLYPLVSLPIVVFVLRERIGFREGTGIILALAAVAAISMETPPKNPPLEMDQNKTT